MMSNSHKQARAKLIAATLMGTWRRSVNAPSISEAELNEITPLLLGSGAGALGWRRIQGTSLSTSRAALQLKQAYHLHSVHALLYQHKIKQAFSLLRINEIEPILIKGWANARLYPEPGLRPYGDIDLCVGPDQFQRASSVLDTQEGRECWVDLHKGIGRLDGRDWDEFFGRSQLVSLDDVKVRVLGDEDQLHVSCVHLLDHGAWRPIWLCDVAAFVESVSEEFDWDVCLGNDKRRAKWVISAIGLARQLLKARIEHCPASVRDAQLPGWLVPGVLKQWERPCTNDHKPPELIAKSLRRPISVPKALVKRWPDPIGSTIRLKGEFNELPRLPFQICAYVGKYMAFAARLPAILQGEKS